MEFRWVIVITLWTMLIGPVFGPPSPRTKDAGAPAAAQAKTPSRP